MAEVASKSAKHRAGMRTRRRVLGDAYVERAERNKTPFDVPFQALITEAAWGSVWSRPQLTLRERSMITVSLLAARGVDDELKLHLRSTANTGASREDIREVLLHVAIYAGAPAANHAMAVALQVFAEIDRDQGKDKDKA
jgi:4-carboxymuconolactone decarboxylase